MHESDENKPFDEEMFHAVLSASMSMRKKLHNEASENILFYKHITIDVIKYRTRLLLDKKCSC